MRYWKPVLTLRVFMYKRQLYTHKSRGEPVQPLMRRLERHPSPNLSAPHTKGMGSRPKVLALALLMLGVFANDHDAALALDDLALFADGLNGRSHFHRWFTS